MNLTTFILISGLVYATVSLLMLRFKAHHLLWVLFFGGLFSVTYLFNMRFAQTIYAGMSGPGSFFVGFINNVAKGHLLSDTYNKNLTMAQPPLFFWFAGGVARLSGWSALQVARALPIFLFPFCSVLLYVMGRKVKGSLYGLSVTLTVTILGSTYAGSILHDQGWAFPHLVVIKPYEILGAILSAWWVFLCWRITTSRGESKLERATAGVVGGLVFLLYIPYFVAGTLAILLNTLVLLMKEERRSSLLAGVMAVLLLSIAVSSVHWFPYALDVWRYGTEDYVSRAMTWSHLDLMYGTFGLGQAGSLFILGLYGIYKYGDQQIVRALKPLLIVCYLWYFSTFLTVPLLGRSFLPGRAWHLLVVAWGFVAALSLEELLRKAIETRLYAKPGAVILGIGLSFILMPNFGWHGLSDRNFREAVRAMPLETQEIADLLNRLPATNSTVLCSKELLYYLPAFTQANFFVAPGSTLSTPASIWSRRISFVETLARSTTSKELWKRLTNGPVEPIEVLILKKGEDGLYHFAATTIAPPDAPERNTITGSLDRYTFIDIAFQPTLFESTHFRKVYESEGFIVWVVR